MVLADVVWCPPTHHLAFRQLAVRNKCKQVSAPQLNFSYAYKNNGTCTGLNERKRAAVANPNRHPARRRRRQAHRRPRPRRPRPLRVPVSSPLQFAATQRILSLVTFPCEVPREWGLFVKFARQVGEHQLLLILNFLTRRFATFCHPFCTTTVDFFLRHIIAERHVGDDERHEESQAV